MSVCDHERCSSRTWRRTAHAPEPRRQTGPAVGAGQVDSSDVRRRRLKLYLQMGKPKKAPLPTELFYVVLN